MALQVQLPLRSLRLAPPSSLALFHLRHASTSTHPPYPIHTTYPPPHPNGPSTHYRRRDSGLYGASTIQFGNLISEKNEHKSRRVWRPNVHRKRLWSDLLGRFVQVVVQARVLRTIDRVGGLDEYLVGRDNPARVEELGVLGWKLRGRVMRSKAYKERVVAERRRLGLPERGWMVEERERRRRERREVARVAEEYLEALKLEEASAAELADVEGEVEPDFEVEEEDPTAEDRDLTEPIDDAATVAPSEHTQLRSELLYAQLTAMADQMHTTPQSLLIRVRDIIRHRTQQLAAAAETKVQRAAAQSRLVADIDAALASPKPGDILSLYTTHLASARAEDALARDQRGKPPLSKQQIAQHVLGPPANVPAAKWAEVRARVRAIQRAQPLRLKERRERHARNVERRRYWAEHREEFLAEKARKMAALSVVKRAMYGVRAAGKGPVGVWGRVRGMLGLGTGRKKEVVVRDA